MQQSRRRRRLFAEVASLDVFLLARCLWCHLWLPLQQIAYAPALAAESIRAVAFQISYLATVGLLLWLFGPFSVWAHSDARKPFVVGYSRNLLMFCACPSRCESDIFLRCSYLFHFACNPLALLSPSLAMIFAPEKLRMMS
mmetsp:Transcript_128153/g.410797  ORF Transcript_128153/g.410797 Transcript_128153/m.410797 type:complete len:141 (+) Transcript_128153:145-567(+)